MKFEMTRCNQCGSEMLMGANPDEYWFKHTSREPKSRDFFGPALDEYLRAYYGQPLDVMHHVQAIRGGSVQECLDWLARYVDAGAEHLILRIGSLRPRPESVAEQLLSALKEIP